MIIGLVPALLIPAFHARALSKTAPAGPAGGASSGASPETFAYDPLHTQVFFTINHMGFTTVRGRFNTFRGTFTLDEKTPALSRADFTIDSASVDMASDIWDKHIMDDFLDTAHYPTITFASTRVVQTGQKTALLTGNLTRHGVTKPVTLHVTLNKVGPNPFMSDRVDAGFQVTGDIRRSDFGMSKFIPVVGDDVGIDIAVDGFRQDFKLNK